MPLHACLALPAPPAADVLSALLGGAAAAAVILDLAALGLLAVLGIHRLTLAWRARAAPPAYQAPEADRDWPCVTVQCPLYNEPTVAARLVHAACRLDYPRDRLRVQVLDDSDDGTTAVVERVASAHRAAGVNVTVLRRPRRTGYKAGALAHGLALTASPLVAIFDADFVPPRDFLRRMVPSFDDPAIGMVQARWGHLNRERSLLTRIQALLLDAHFLIEHAGRVRAGWFFNFNGTAGVFRRTCIEDAGGWQHDTLTEDLDLSYRAQLAGWRFAFREDVVVDAELPARLPAWKGQQRRWTQGAVQSARKLLPSVLGAPLPWRTKLEALAHLAGNSAYVPLLALAVLTFPAALARRAWGWDALPGLEVPLLLATTGVVAVFYLTAARRAGSSLLAAVRLLPGLIALGVGSSLNSARAILAGLRHDGGEFVRTPKDGEGLTVVAPAMAGRRSGTGWALAEVGLGALLMVETGAAALLGLWPTLPFLALFAAGFLAVGIGSLRRGPAPTAVD